MLLADIATPGTYRAATPKLRAKAQRTLDAMRGHLAIGLLATFLVLGAWLGWVLWRRRLAAVQSATRHATVDELVTMMASDTPPLILDLRSVLPAPAELLPGALRTTIDHLPAAIAHWPKDRSVVTVCACPQGATAQMAARILTTSGYKLARPLGGGHDAWNKRFSCDTTLMLGSQSRSS